MARTNRGSPDNGRLTRGARRNPSHRLSRLGTSHLPDLAAGGAAGIGPAGTTSSRRDRHPLAEGSGGAVATEEVAVVRDGGPAVQREQRGDGPGLQLAMLEDEAATAMQQAPRGR